MVMSAVHNPTLDQVVYPESDGEPMAESWLQAEVIRLLVTGFIRLFAGHPGVLVLSPSNTYREMLRKRDF